MICRPRCIAIKRIAFVSLLFQSILYFAVSTHAGPFQLDILKQDEKTLLSGDWLSKHRYEFEETLDETFEITSDMNPNLKSPVLLKDASPISLAVAMNMPELVKGIATTVMKIRGNSEYSKRWIEKQTTSISGRYALQKLSPLHLALLTWGTPSMLRTIVELGHNVNIVNEKDRRLDGLMIAAQLGDLSSCKTLVELGATVDMMDRSKDVLVPMHPVHAATMGNHSDVIKYFVKEQNISPDLQYRPNYGEAPLHVAVHRGYFNLVKMLIEELGANYDVVNEQDNHRPYTIALQWNRKDIANYLKTLYVRDNKPLPSMKDTMPIGVQPKGVVRTGDHRSEL